MKEFKNLKEGEFDWLIAAFSDDYCVTRRNGNIELLRVEHCWIGEEPTESEVCEKVTDIFYDAPCTIKRTYLLLSNNKYIDDFHKRTAVDEYIIKNQIQNPKIIELLGSTNNNVWILLKSMGATFEQYDDEI